VANSLVVDIDPLSAPTSRDRSFEVVERKGLGHPDTICDALAEEVSRALSRYYVERCGRVLHHNVDKALLCGGTADVRYGGGEVTAPIEIILAGRATSSWKGVLIPTVEIATETCRAWLGEHLPGLDLERHVRIECRLRPGSPDLVDLYGRSGDRALPLANDTSIGVGFAPLSPLEQTVLDTERWLNARATKLAHPAAGEDVKVLGTRRGARVFLTVACAFVSKHVRDAGDYLDKKARLAGALAQLAGRTIVPNDVTLNAADDASTESFYLTVTGTSAESGDDGQVGRGNRVNGLITPGRPMTLEAAAGKNPVSHVGKLYNVAAGLMARQLVENLPGVSAAECTLVSQIGAPIDEPRLVGLRLATTSPALNARDRDAANELVRVVLARLPALSLQLVAGDITVF
jgi:S-adenosylmethionine synthetase